MAKFKNAQAIVNENARIDRARAADRNRSTIRRATPPAGWDQLSGGGYRNPTGFEFRPTQGPVQQRGLGVSEMPGATAQTTPQSTLGSIFLRRLRQRLMENDKRGRDAMNAPISRRQ